MGTSHKLVLLLGRLGHHGGVNDLAQPVTAHDNVEHYKRANCRRDFFCCAYNYES